MLYGDELAQSRLEWLTSVSWSDPTPWHEAAEMSSGDKEAWDYYTLNVSLVDRGTVYGCQ